MGQGARTRGAQRARGRVGHAVVLLSAASCVLQPAAAQADVAELAAFRSELQRLRAENAWLRSRGADPGRPHLLAASVGLVEELGEPAPPLTAALGVGGEPAESEPLPGASAGPGEEEEEPLVGGEEEGEGESEGESFSPVDVGCGWMLLGSVAMVMVLFYLVNWHDDDIRRFSWHIVSTTVSIFTAVLVFTSISDFVLDFLLSELLGWERHGWILLLVEYGLLVLWFWALQAMTFYQSGSYDPHNAVAYRQTVWVIAEPLRADCGTEVPEREVRNANGTKSIAYRDFREVFVQKKAMRRERFERRTRCWATLFAHMTGFAAISAGGNLQHSDIFARTPLMAFLAVVLNLVLLLALFGAAALLRAIGRSRSDDGGEESGCRQLYLEEVEEAENDVLSLSTSFLTVQAIRFALTGVLPGTAGLEEPEVARGTTCVLGLYGAGVGAALTVMVLLLLQRGESRVLEAAQNTFAMTFAWCLLWATRWLALGWPLLEEVRAAPASLLGRVLLALVLSSVALLAIFVLDVVEDRAQGARVARVIQNMVNALSILVGFSWEHCFDCGVEAVAATTSSPVLMNLVFTALVAVVIIPAWRQNILARVLYLNGEQEDILAARQRGASEERSPLTNREEEDCGEKCW